MNPTFHNVVHTHMHAPHNHRAQLPFQVQMRTTVQKNRGEIVICLRAKGITKVEGTGETICSRRHTAFHRLGCKRRPGFDSLCPGADQGF